MSSWDKAQIKLVLEINSLCFSVITKKQEQQLKRCTVTGFSGVDLKVYILPSLKFHILCMSTHAIQRITRTVLTTEVSSMEALQENSVVKHCRRQIITSPAAVDYSEKQHLLN